MARSSSSSPRPMKWGRSLPSRSRSSPRSLGGAWSGDKLFFDMPPVEHAEHFIVEAMKKAETDPAVIYAFEKTGLLVTEANEHLISEVDRAAWEAAVLEYRAKHGDESEEDEENEWF